MELLVAAAAIAGGNWQTENNLLVSKWSVHQQQVAFVAGHRRRLYIYSLTAVATDGMKGGQEEEETVPLFSL